MYFVAENIYRS